MHLCVAITVSIMFPRARRRRRGLRPAAAPLWLCVAPWTDGGGAVPVENEKSVVAVGGAPARRGPPGPASRPAATREPPACVLRLDEHGVGERSGAPSPLLFVGFP